MRIPAAAIVIQALLEKNVTMATLWTSLGILVASLIVTMGYKEDMARCRNYVAEHLREELTPAEPAKRSAAFEISRQTPPHIPQRHSCALHCKYLPASASSSCHTG